MKKYPKIVQCDTRGQIVIPKEVRQSLGIDEGTGFFMFTIKEEGILLKKINDIILEEEPSIVELKEKSDIIGIKKNNLTSTFESYKKRERMEEI